MKKLLIVLLVLLTIAVTALGQDMRHVADQAGTFSAEQVKQLETRMQALYEKYNFDTVIVTTRDSRGQTAQMYAEDFYNEFRSYSEYPNGLIFSFSFDLGEYYEATRGIGQRIFSDQGADQLDTLLRPHLSGKRYFQAMSAYLDYVEGRLSRFAVIGNDGKVTLTTKIQPPNLSQSIRIATGYLPFMLIGGVAVGLLVALHMKSKLLIAKQQASANEYTRSGAIQLYDRSDVYLYQTVTRSRIQQPRSTGGGGGGGSSGGSFRSSSGGSYGGRGGKL